MVETHLPAPVFVASARAGLAARALVYLLIAGLLAWSVIFLRVNQDGVSPDEAFRWIENKPGGITLLFATGLGLGLYSLWRFEQAIFDVERVGNDTKGYVARAGMLASGFGYGAVGFGALAIATSTDNGGAATARRRSRTGSLNNPLEMSP